jgi:hypothetical protein
VKAPRLALVTALAAALASPAACGSSSSDSPAAPVSDASAAEAAASDADGASDDATAADAGPDAAPAPRSRITFPGIGPIGVFDPSLASASGEARVWMAYSEVLPSPMWPAANPRAVRTRLARTDDQGASFVDVAANLTSFLDVTLPLAPPNDAGTWVAEVSSLVWDEGALPAERWKVAFHHYLTINGARRFEHGWVGLKSAASPELLGAAPEVKLFVGALYDAGNDVAGGGSRSPLGGAPVLHVETLHAELAGCLAFSEPSLFATSASLEIALGCAKSATDGRILRLACTSPCTPTNAASWTYAGTLLTSADATALGYDEGFSAPSLVRTASGGRALLVTPVKSTPFEAFYDGCLVFPLTGSGALGSSGAKPSFVVPGTAGAFRGACDYSPKASAAGILLSELDANATDAFRLFATHLAIP